MSKHFAMQQFLAEGTSVERSLMKQDAVAEAKKFAKPTPENKYATIREMLADARAGKIDREVFKEFVKRTHSISAVEEILDWETYQREVRFGTKLRC
jgi:predicted transcriptional regulator